jgi:hypothetical protein
MDAALLAWLLLVVAPPAATAAGDAAAPPLAIEHAAPACFAAGRPPRVRARFSPPAGVARARVVFSAAAGDASPVVAMAARGEWWDAALPAPLPRAEAVRYRIVVESSSATVTESAWHVVPVRASCVDMPSADTRRGVGFGAGRGAAVVVGALGAAFAVDKALDDPVRSAGQVTLLDVSPPAGATIRAGDPVRFTVRIVPSVTVTSSPELELMQSPEAPVCFALVAPSFRTHQPGVAETETFSGIFQNVGGCGEVTLARARLGHAVPGPPLEAGGPGRFDLPIRYSIAR